MMYGSDDLGFLLADEFDLLGVTTTVTDKIDALMQDSKPFGTTGKWNQSRPTGDLSCEFSQGGWFDDASASINAAMSKNGSVARVVAYGIEGNAKSKTYLGLAGAFGAAYTVKMMRNGMTEADVVYSMGGIVEKVTILQERAVLAGDGNTTAASVEQALNPRVPTIAITSSSVANPTHIITPVPHGLITGDQALVAGHSGSTPTINGLRTVTRVSDTELTIPVNVSVGGTGGTIKKVWTKNGGAGWLHVPALTLSGRTNVVFTVRHSADNITFVDLFSFTARTTNGAERKTVAAGTTVNEYLAVSRAFTGAGGSPTVEALVGFIRA